MDYVCLMYDIRKQEAELTTRHVANEQVRLTAVKWISAIKDRSGCHRIGRHYEQERNRRRRGSCASEG